MTILLPVSLVGAVLLCSLLLTGYFFFCKERWDHFFASFSVACVTTFPVLIIKKCSNNSLEISLLLSMRKVCKQGEQSIFSALFTFTSKIMEVVFAGDFLNQLLLHCVNSDAGFVTRIWIYISCISCLWQHMIILLKCALVIANQYAWYRIFPII